MSEQLIQTPAVFGENGNFLLERELGAGGMGGVYMGRDKMLDRPVAVKVMLKSLGSDPEFVEKFKKEAQSAARLIHPNIAQIYSYGIHEDMPYIAMELASGGSLYSIMQTNPGKTDISRILKICQQVAQALQCASDQGCVHGDVKPENILLDANGNAKLVDFGLAAMQKDTTEIWGTPYYISPEKVKKEVLDFRADMYSLGGTLYHALTGVAPFEGSDPVEVVKKRFLGAPKKPSELRPEITPALDNLVMTMLALEKGNRYPSFEALLKAFTDVLTNGLVANKTSSESSASSAKPASGARRLTTVRGGRRMTMKRPGGMSKVAENAEDTETENPKKKPEDDEEEESGGGLGLKVALCVIGGIVVIGALAGFLIWLPMHKAAQDREEHQQQVSAKIAEARSAIAGWQKKANDYDVEFTSFAANATIECTKFTTELKKLLPDFADGMQPPPTKELLDAIALTNVVAAADGGTNAVAAAGATNAVAAATNSAPAAAAAPAAADPKKPMSLAEEAKALGIKPPPDDLDPASPDYEEFMNELKAARERAKNGGTKPAEEPNAEAPATADTSASPAEPPKPPPAVIQDLHDLWERTYSCQASAIRISIAAKKVIETCQKASEFKDESDASMNGLVELSNSAKSLYEEMTGSKDVENVKKGIGFIKSKGKKAVEQTVKRLRIERLEKERADKKAAAEQAEKERLEKLAADKKAKGEAEVAEIKAKFDSLAAQGCLRQLDWKSAQRQLNDAAQFFTTPEGEITLKEQLKKVEVMKKVQDIFLKHLKGHQFRGKLKGCKVVDVNEKELFILKTDGKTKQKILWQKFYKDYPGNFNEIINYYIFNGRKRLGLNLRDWSDAMIGAAMTMKLVCPEVNGALERSQALAKEVVKQYPDYEKFAKDAFPDVDFSDAKATEE